MERMAGIEHSLCQGDESGVEEIVFVRKCGVMRGDRKGGVRDRKQTTVEGGVAEVTDGGKRCRGRHEDVVGRQGVGREAREESVARPKLLRRPAGESSGEENI
jgi:hypothetical protein